MSQNPQANLIMDSGIFDDAYYFSQLDGKTAGAVAAVEHYLASGASLGLNPHPLFNSAFYLKTYPDVAAAGMNPLVHYLLHGASEGRYPNQFFDSAYYFSSLSESERSKVNPLTHYLRSTIVEKGATHPQFDTHLYCTFYPEVLISGVDPLLHYLQKGADQKRLSHIEFDPQFYLNTYTDVAAAGLDPVQHYRLYGRAEGRLPCSAQQRFQSLERFEKVLHAHVQSDSKKSKASSTASSSEVVNRDRSQDFVSENSDKMLVYWGCHLFERRLLEQFLEVARRIPDIRICIHNEFLGDAGVLPTNVQVLDMVLSELDIFAGSSVFIAPVDGSPVSDLLLRAIESGLLIVCSDDCELSRIVSPSEASILPQGINAEKIVHAISYAAANRQTAATRAEATRAKLITYSRQLDSSGS